MQPLLLALTLLIFVSVNGCGPDMPERVLPTKKTPQCENEKKPAKPTVAKPALSEPLADPEIDADSEVLRVGITHDTPPFIYKKDKKVQGLEMDLAQQLGTFSGKTVQFVRVPEKRATEALLKGHIDIVMSGRKISSSEDCNVTFSEPYLRAGQILLARNRDVPIFSTGIYSLADSGFSVGVVQGSGGDLFLTRTIRGVRIIRFKTVENAIEALTRKKIDILLHDAPTICHYAAIKPSAGLTPILTLVTEEYLGWEMRKEDEELQKQANQFIRQSKNDGQLQKTIKQWIPNL